MPSWTKAAVRYNWQFLPTMFHCDHEDRECSTLVGRLAVCQERREDIWENRLLPIWTVLRQIVEAMDPLLMIELWIEVTSHSSPLCTLKCQQSRHDNRLKKWSREQCDHPLPCCLCDLECVFNHRCRKSWHSAESAQLSKGKWTDFQIRWTS